MRGVEFRSEEAPRPSKVNSERSLVLRGNAADREPEEGWGGSENGAMAAPSEMDMTARFARQTGLIGQLVNKHM